jgi:hypothetical protein
MYIHAYIVCIKNIKHIQIIKSSEHTWNYPLFNFELSISQIPLWLSNIIYVMYILHTYATLSSWKALQSLQKIPSSSLQGWTVDGWVWCIPISPTYHGCLGCCWFPIPPRMMMLWWCYDDVMMMMMTLRLKWLTRIFGQGWRLMSTNCCWLTFTFLFVTSQVHTIVSTLWKLT